MQLNLTLEQAVMIHDVLRAVDQVLRPDEFGHLEAGKAPAIDFTPEQGRTFRDAINKLEQTEV